MKVILTNHAKYRLLERGIGVHDVKNIAKNGEIVKSEENGIIKKRGFAHDEKNLIVISREEKGEIVIISAYYEY